MERLTTSEPTDTPELAKKKHFGKKARAIGTLTLCLGLGGASTFYAFYNNEQNADEAVAAAHTIAANRNTCGFKSVGLTQSAGKPALRVQVDLFPKTSPGNHNHTHDHWNTDASYRDERGNMVSGLIIQNTVTGHYILNSGPYDGPDSITNSAEISVDSPLLTPGRTTYKVSRLNAVSATVENVLTPNRYPLVNEAVPCGSFEFNATKPPIETDPGLTPTPTPPVLYR